MKKVIFSVIIALSVALAFTGCIRHDTDLTINPVMTANIDATNFFTAATVVPSTFLNQIADTGTILIITANSALLQQGGGDQIILNINKYTGNTGTFSMIQNQAAAAYVHSGTESVANGGFVSITRVTSNEITGYFSFTTTDSHAVTNGSFTVGKP